jgi:hypothetical protein
MQSVRAEQIGGYDSGQVSLLMAEVRDRQQTVREDWLSMGLASAVTGTILAPLLVAYAIRHPGPFWGSFAVVDMIAVGLGMMVAMASAVLVLNIKTDGLDEFSREYRSYAEHKLGSHNHASQRLLQDVSLPKSIASRVESIASAFPDLPWKAVRYGPITMVGVLPNAGSRSQEIFIVIGICGRFKEIEPR